MSTAEQLVALGASLFARGLTFGRTGNLSALDADGTLLLTPTGISLGELDVDSLSRIDPRGQHIGGLPPTKEAFLHQAMYRARPSARAVVHTLHLLGRGVVHAGHQRRQRDPAADRLLRDARRKASAAALPRTR